MNSYYLTAAVLCTAVLATTTAGAQPGMSSPIVEAPEIIDNGPRDWRTIKLNYARPSIVAWWIDAAHHPEPAHFVEGRRLLESVAGKVVRPADPAVKPGPHKGLFDRPAGVDELKADDTHRTLAAFATADGLDRLRKMINSLDQPVKAVGINVELFETGGDLVKQFAADTPVTEEPARPDTTHPGDTPGLITLRPGAHAVLDKLTAAGRARVVASFQLNANNNLPASDTVALGATGQGGRMNGSLTLVVTPTVNIDNTITLAIIVRGSNQPLPSPSPAPQTFSRQSIVNLSPDDSLLLSGLNLGLTPPPAAISPVPPHDRRLFLLVKARVLEGEPLSVGLFSRV